MPEFVAKYTEIRLEFVRKLDNDEWHKPESYFDKKGFVSKAGNLYVQKERPKYHFFKADDVYEAKKSAREELTMSGERILSLDELFEVRKIPLD